MKECYVSFGWAREILAVSLSLSEAQEIGGVRYIERRPLGVSIDPLLISIWVWDGWKWLEVLPDERPDPSRPL